VRQQLWASAYVKKAGVSRRASGKVWQKYKCHYGKGSAAKENGGKLSALSPRCLLPNLAHRQHSDREH